jgi:hypothetical protein
LVSNRSAIATVAVPCLITVIRANTSGRIDESAVSAAALMI